MRFFDRADAGRRLVPLLEPWREAQPVVLALPRGGVPVAAPIAAALHAPLEVLLIRKLGAPRQRELAIGAIAEGIEPDLMLNPATIRRARVRPEYIEAEAARERGVIAERRALYREGRPPIPLMDRTVILVDDGVATGASTLIAIRAVKQQTPRRVILAVPVAPRDTLVTLKREADAVVVLEAAADFFAVGQFYEHFEAVSDAEVVRLLREAQRTT